MKELIFLLFNLFTARRQTIYFHPIITVEYVQCDVVSAGDTFANSPLLN